MIYIGQPNDLELSEHTYVASKLSHKVEMFTNPPGSANTARVHEHDSSTVMEQGSNGCRDPVDCFGWNGYKIDRRVFHDPISSAAVLSIQPFLENGGVWPS